MALPKEKDIFKGLLGGGTKPKLIDILLDKARPPEVSAKMLLDLIHSSQHDPVGVQGLLTDLMKYLVHGKNTPEAEVAQLKERYEKALAELEQGPPIPATFVGMADVDMPGAEARAHVVTFDGQPRFPIFHPKVKNANFDRGMTVYLDNKGIIILGKSQSVQEVGQEATFLRTLDGSNLVEASIHDEPIILYAAQPVIDAAKSGTLKRNDRVLICPRREFAYRPIPCETDHRYRFVDTSRIQEITVAQDIGKPHWVLNYLVRRTQLLMFRPDLLKKYDLRPRITALLTGPSGTGKTLTIKAFLWKFWEMLKQRTGLDTLGSRVVRAKLAELLSEYLGRADKNIDKLFTELYSIASETLTTADGERILLPCVLILEEAEGLARRRGGDFDNGVYDRIMGTLLQRLDDPTDDFGKLPLIILTTSNRPDLFDVAMWRRLAGIRAHFPRLDREGFFSVLSKKLKPNYPYASCNGYAPAVLRQRVIDQLVSAFYSPNSDDKGMVEITLRDGKKLIRHARHFLTGSIVEQAVANAIDQTVFAAEETGEDAGLAVATLLNAFRNHLEGLADNLTPHNVGDYLDIPEQTHVAFVRKLRTTGPLSDVVAQH